MLHKQIRLDFCQRLDHCGSEHDAFLDRIITGGETLIHHCKLEDKQQSMEWKYPQSPTRKSSKANHPQEN
jgi:hypothetical protein